MSDHQEVKDHYKIIKELPNASFKGLYIDQLKERNKFYRTRVMKLFSTFVGGTGIILFIYVMSLYTAVTLIEGQEDAYMEFNHKFLLTWYEI